MPWVLVGERTRLRLVEEGDLDLLAGWFGDEAFVEHWGGRPLSRAEVADKYVGRRRPDVESFVVEADGSAVGYAQFWRAGSNEGGIDLVLTPAAQGHGYGPDAADTLAHHLLSVLGWTRVKVDPAADNVRAVRAWEKAGFTAVGQDGDALLMERRRNRSATERVPPSCP